MWLRIRRSFLCWIFFRKKKGGVVAGCEKDGAFIKQSLHRVDSVLALPARFV